MIKKHKKRKLVLFDIDGTLIRHIETHGRLRGVDRFPHSIKHVYGIDIDPLGKDWPYNGMTDRQIAWEMVRTKGVTQEIFVQGLPALGVQFCLFLENATAKTRLYEAIVEAKLLAQSVADTTHIDRGVLSGNLGAAGWWKLEHTGLRSLFEFGLFGHEAENRNELAMMVFERAKKAFGKSYKPQEIIIIGDTVHDIRCGKAIGAVTVAVTTGYHVSGDDLLGEKPDLMVDSLLDPRVRTLIGLT